MKNLRINVMLLSLVALVSLTNCGKDKNGAADSALGENLSGKIDGQAWKHTFGAVTYRAITKNYTVSLYALPPNGDPCDAKVASGATFYFAAFNVKELKVMELDASGDNNSASIMLTRAVNKMGGFESKSVGGFGKARFTKVDADNIEGQLDVKGGDNDYVKGTFKAKICKN